MKARFRHVLYSLLIAVCFLLVRGYYFNTDDQAEHLPQVYQILDTELYPADYFVPYSNSIVTVRFFFEKLMLSAGSFLGIEILCFLLTMLSLTVLVRSIMGITEKFFPSSEAKWLAPVIVLFVFYGFTVGGNHITYPSLISSTIAKAFAAFAFWKLLQNKFLIAGIALGTGALFQPLAALQLALILSGTKFLLQPKDWRSILRFVIPFLGLTCLILIPILLRQMDQKALEDERYWQILYKFRNYHHYLPSLFPIGHYVKATGLALLGLISFLFLKPRLTRFYLVFMALTVTGLMIYSICLEWNTYPQIGKIQWFKTTIWIGLLSSIGVTGLLVQMPKVSILLKLFTRSGPMLIGLISVSGILLLNSAWIPNSSGKHMVGNYIVSDLERMHDWIYHNTEKSVMVLVPPDDNSFSCQAKRSIPVHYTAIVHEPKFMLEWYDRYSKIYGVSLENLQENAKDDAVDLYQNRNYRDAEFSIDMRLDNLETCQFVNELGPIIHQEGNWILTEFQVKN